MIRSQSRIGAFTGLTALLLSTVFTGSSQAEDLQCGSVITDNTVLHSDIGPCAAGGLIIAADNVTLNLNGHNVFGTPNQGDGVGIRVANSTGVQVTGGTVQFFDAGIVVRGGGSNRISHIVAADNAAPVLGDFGDGILLDSTSNNVIAQNQVLRNGPYDGIGVLGTSSGNRIEHNLVEDNNITSTRCSIFRCQTVQFAAGIALEPGSTLAEPGDGSLGATGNTVTNNIVKGNGRYGIRISEYGGAFGSAGDNVVSDNVVQKNGVYPPGPGSFGIVLLPGAEGSLVQGNRALENASTGIGVSSQQSRILNNVALRSGSVDLSDFSTPGTLCGFDDPWCMPSVASCDNNVWQDNVFGSANPPCAANGTQVGPPPSKPSRPSSSPQDVPPPRRGSTT